MQQSTPYGIDLNAAAIHELCRKWKIEQLSVFGSILRDDFGPDSDIDLIADYQADAEWDICDHLDMEEELAQILGRKVDLVSRGAIDASRNRFFKEEVLSSAEPVVAAG